MSLVDIRNLSANAGQPVDMAHGRYTSTVARRTAFVACNQSGVTSQAGLSATTPVLSLYNPIGSGVVAVILFAKASLLVASAAANQVWLALNTNTAAAAVTGTAATVRNLWAGGASPQCSALLAATLPAAPVATHLLGTGLTGAINTTPGYVGFERYIDGGIILPENTCLSFQTSTASGANGLLCEIQWEEITTT